jgi:hypothetical protein
LDDADDERNLRFARVGVVAAGDVGEMMIEVKTS